jgi:hypothetical protein
MKSWAWLIASAATACSGAGPTTLATENGEPAGIAVQNGTVYWANLGGTIMSVPSGGGTPTTLATGQSQPSAIAVDGSSVYWTNTGQACAVQPGTCGATPDGSVMRVPLAGGTPTPLATGLCGPNSIAIDAVNAYVVVSSASILKIPLAGGAPTTLAHGFSIGTLAVDATSVYYTSTDASFESGQVMKVPVGGGAPVTLASGFAPFFSAVGCVEATSLAVNGGSVYWLTGQLNVAPSLMKVAVGGGTTITLVETAYLGAGSAITLAVDGTGAYWAGSSAFFREPLEGGSAETIAVFGGGPSSQAGGIALDAQNLYWTDPTGAVRSTPKSP